ncbi:hypothetical protein CCR75_008681 [Bremia lactucae]|uniref:La-related protein 7 n=1 Tax=Bremia lactucae TaxID=4779 RepID=A0A976IE93_BRELC|nr:hypothetical protein CCR75_008681 [Bremia lactucae]
MVADSTSTRKSLRKQIKRQLEFYLSESNLRQDKFLQKAMDEMGFVPVSVILSFNKLKGLNATERMILDEADKSPMIRVDRVKCCIAPKIFLETSQGDEADARTIYFDNFCATDDHDSLRRVFARFGKVTLVTLPRFRLSKKFKGFGFVEFADQTAAENAAAESLNLDLRGIRVLSKTRWIQMKEDLKRQLTCVDAKVESGKARESASGSSIVGNVTGGDACIGNKKRKLQQTARGDSHLIFTFDKDSDISGNIQL